MTNGLRVISDEEALPFAAGSLDLVVSALALQFVNDLPGALIQIRRALKPDGLLLAALIGGDSLTELRSAFAAAEAKSRAVSRRASRLSPTSASLAAFCSAPVLRCRSSIANESRCATIWLLR